MKKKEIYEKLRSAHSLVKDILYSEELTEREKNSLETLHGVFYMVEALFTDF